MTHTLSSLDVDALTRTLSAERLDYWTEQAGGDIQRAFLLHRRNALVSGLFLVDLQVIEVALRNAFDEELKSDFGADWLEARRFRDTKPVRDAKRWARRDWKDGGNPGSPPRDKVIVQLNFGFWKFLFAEVDLQPILFRAFRNKVIDPHKQKGPDKLVDPAYVSTSLDRLHRIRNELAHHEPIIVRDGTRHQEDLSGVLDGLHNLLLALCPVTAVWAERFSFVRPLVGTKLFSCDEPGEHEVTFFVP